MWSPVNISPLALIRDPAMPRKDNANIPASAQAQQEAVPEGIENFELSPSSRDAYSEICCTCASVHTRGGVVCVHTRES
jgi:hypothetical protein